MQIKLCSGCAKTEFALEEGRKLRACGSCKARKAGTPAYYCSRSCQKKDWKKNGHRIECYGPAFSAPQVLAEGPWVEKARRNTQDGSVHRGKLQLITWECVDDDDGVKLGWGGVYADEAEELKERFEKELGGSLEKMFEDRDMAFRWTCCGYDASSGTHGCDHHGATDAGRPCGCDFCSAGLAVPDAIYNKAKIEKMGLKLRRGPDPRGKTMAGEFNMMMRNVLGMPV